MKMQKPIFMPSNQSIEKYREIYRQQFGIELSQEEAAEQAARLLNLAKIVFQPMSKDWESRYSELLKKRSKEN